MKYNVIVFYNERITHVSVNDMFDFLDEVGLPSGVPKPEDTNERDHLFRIEFEEEQEAREAARFLVGKQFMGHDIVKVGYEDAEGKRIEDIDALLNQ